MGTEGLIEYTISLEESPDELAAMDRFEGMAVTVIDRF